MLEIDANLPPGALCAARPGALADAFQGAHWWHGAPDQMDQDPATGALSLWRSATGGPPMEPTVPNAGNGQIGEVDDLYGLQCRTGVHCGTVAEDAAPNASNTTVAVRFYTPPGENARTLFALNAMGSGNYIFLSQTADTLTAKDDQGRATVTLPYSDVDAPRLAIVSLHGDRLSLSLGQQRGDMKASQAILTGPASLFVGCRNQRPRLLKTLGSALILDVFLFPGRALLHEPRGPDLAALQRHHLWAAA